MLPPQIASPATSRTNQQPLPRRSQPRSIPSGTGSIFWWHFLEMSAAMWIGMVVGGVLFTAILAGFGTTITEVRLQYPELAVLVMGVNMTLPMVAWMRHCGHGWRSSAEMAAAMFVPAIPVIALLRSEMIAFAAVCGLYCAVMMAAMLALMGYRRSEYTM
jgi:flagellar biosynthetic protein FliP